MKAFVRAHNTRYRLPIFLTISLLTHLAVVIYFVYNLQEGIDRLIVPAKTPKILVDLTDPRNDIFDSQKKVISRYNYTGKGKLSPKSGQHLPGKYNSIALPESTSMQKQEISMMYLEKSKENLKEKMLPNSDTGRKAAKENDEENDKKNFSSSKDFLKQQKKKLTSQKNSRLSVDTENSLENKFWFNESDFLQISTRSHSDAEFSLELANLLKKRFSTYISGGGSLNFYHVKRDEAMVLATINYQGVISYKKMISASKTQPYMNYLASRVVDNPGIITNLPPELRGKKSGSLVFFFNISFTGEPLRKWWMGFEFLPESKNN